MLYSRIFMDQEGAESFLIVFSIVAFAMALTVILLFAIFQKRKNKLLQEQQIAENRFQREIIETQVEIREETLRNISWELHDNIGQLLTLAKIQLGQVDDSDHRISEAEQTLTQCLEELRSLSKLINPDTFSTLSLMEALKLEMERFNRMQYLETQLILSKETFELDTKVETIIFRILQEFFTNTIKHSKASKLTVAVQYEADSLYISASDNGVGFDTTTKDYEGIGLSNIKNRAALIGAQVSLTSKKDEGTQIELTYKNNGHGAYSSSR